MSATTKRNDMLTRKLLIALLLFFSLCASAQPKFFEPELYIGPNFGITGSMVMFNPTVSQSYLLGYNGGIVVRYNAEKNIGTQIELNYSQRGWKENNGLYARQLNYIEIPFMTHFFFGRNTKFFFNIGPKISYLISEHTIINNAQTLDLQHLTSVQNRIDYGLCSGFGLLFNIKKESIQLDARANYSLSDIFPSISGTDFKNSNNVNVSVNLAWLIRIR